MLITKVVGILISITTGGGSSCIFGKALASAADPPAVGANSTRRLPDGVNTSPASAESIFKLKLTRATDNLRALVGTTSCGGKDNT